MILEVVAILTLIVSVLKFAYELGKDVGKKTDRPKNDHD